ncbi:Glycosyl transferase family 2 [Azoarcus sp. Aa7]|nr:Glycosyl transferase family 2 [Azoarcus sp. Aa7]
MSLTIAIPSYKRPELLIRTLGTLLAQPWRNPPQIVVCVNHPNDGYPEALAPFATSPRIRILQQASHVSSGQQLFAALAHAETEFVVGLADDDELDVAAIEQYVDFLAQFPEIAAVYAPVSYIDYVSGNQFNYNAVPAEGKVINRGDYYGLLAFVAENQHWPELGIYRTAALRGALHASDWSFYELSKLSGLLSHGHVAFVPQPFYVFVLRHQGETERQNLGTGLVMQPAYIERARGGLERLAERAMQQLGNGITQQQFDYISATCRVLFSTRLRESYHAAVNSGQFADALEIALRLRTYLVPLDPPPERLLCGAVIELAHRVLLSRSWKKYLVLYKLGRGEEHARRLDNVLIADDHDLSARVAPDALFLADSRRIEELHDIAPAVDCLSFEEVASHFYLGPQQGPENAGS